MTTSANVQNLNIQVDPGLVAFPPSLHAGIGACDPTTYIQLTPGTLPGKPTASLFACQGTAVPGKYPSMLWAQNNLMPIPPNCNHLNFDVDVTASEAYLKGGNCLEIDTMVAYKKRVFPAGMHIVLAEGGKVQVCNSTGFKWLDAGFSLVLTPDAVHHFTFSTEYNWAENTMTWLGITVDGATYKIAEANAVVVSGTTWGWDSDGFKQQIQMDNLPSAPLITLEVDNCNNTWMP
jgi:hypothetical protein